jgi:hypothetical protein
VTVGHALVQENLNHHGRLGYAGGRPGDGGRKLYMQSFTVPVKLFNHRTGKPVKGDPLFLGLLDGLVFHVGEIDHPLYPVAQKLKVALQYILIQKGPVIADMRCPVHRRPAGEYAHHPRIFGFEPLPFFGQGIIQQQRVFLFSHAASSVLFAHVFCLNIIIFNSLYQQ